MSHWPGWSVPAAPIDTQILLRGLELAKRSFALVVEMDLGPLQEGTGIWLCGAFELALRRHREALVDFILARKHYMAAKAPDLVLLAEGYISLVSQIARHQVPTWHEDVDQVCARLSASGFENAAAWIDQLRTVRTVFRQPTNHSPSWAES